MKYYEMVTDAGYTHVCPTCSKRYGEPLKGARTLTMQQCRQCEAKAQTPKKYSPKKSRLNKNPTLD